MKNSLPLSGAVQGQRPDAAALSKLLSAVRERRPLVQCITNAVTVNFVANALLAVGAAPAMVDLPGEAALCVGAASALLINLGTPNTESMAAMREAARAAREAGKPWVMDPVAVGALPLRTCLARELLSLRPTIIRGNASEIMALAGVGQGGRGVDTADSADSALDAARRLAVITGGAVAVSGPTDIVTDGTTTLRLTNGSDYLTRVTGGGCALGAVMAAFAALDTASLMAAAAATTVYTIAAELAVPTAHGPGSFAVAFMDQLAGITPETITQRAVLQVDEGVSDTIA